MKLYHSFANIMFVQRMTVIYTLSKFNTLYSNLLYKKFEYEVLHLEFFLLI